MSSTIFALAAKTPSTVLIFLPPRYIYTILLLLFLASGKIAYGQTVSINAITGGLTLSPVTPGQSQSAFIGFSVQVSGGSVKFDQFNIASNITLQSYITNGKLYRSSTGDYSTGTNTFVANATFNGSNITFSGLGETIANTTAYYFFAADVNYSGTSINYDVQFYINNGGFAHAVTGSSYPAYSNYRGYRFNATTISVSNETGGLAQSNLILNQAANSAVFGFNVAVTGLTTISQFSISTNNANLGNYFTNIKLYRNTTNTYGTGTATPVGTATVSGSSINITGLSESFASSSAGQTNTCYYFLAVDYTNSTGALPGSLTCSFSSGQATAAITQSSPTSATFNTFNVTGNSFTMSSASVSMSSQQNGLASTTAYAGQTSLAVFGFGLTVTGSSTISAININSNNNSLSTYIGNAKLYSSTTNNYSNGTLSLVGSGTVNGSYVNFTGLSETITNATKYYFLVVDDVYTGTNTSTVAFNFANAQSTNALVQSNPSSSYNNFAVTGTTYNLNPTTIAVTKLTNGIASTDLTYGQTNKAVIGFSLAVTGATTISTIKIKSTSNNISTYFTAKLYRSTTDNFATGFLTQVGTVAFNGSDISISGLAETFTNGETKYYFLAVDVIYYTQSAPQVQFYVGYRQSPAFLVSSGAQSFNTYSFNTDTYTLRYPPPTVTITGINSASNGITQGSLSYGQTNIVLFGFKMEVLGVITISQINLPSSISANPYFTNGRLYRSTTPYFANATLVSGANFAFNDATAISNISQVFTNYSTPTTYYYFIVADLNAATYMSQGSFQYNFNNANAVVQTATPYTNFAANTTNGKAFSIVTAVKWVGTTSSSFSDNTNFRDLQGNNTTVGANTVVEIGVANYTNAPVISGTANIGGITFGTTQTPTLTLGSGATLTVNNGLSAINGVTGTITGPAGTTINITSNAQSAVNSGSTMVLTGGMTVNNAGTITVSGTSKLNITGGTTLANTGTLTLLSDATGSGTIGALADANGNVTGTVTGTVKVERYITGGSLTYRGYRLLSSPVHSGSTAFYDLAYLKGSGSYLTGASGGGWDVNGNPTLYLYRPDRTPNNSSFTSGNFRPITVINNSPNAYLMGTQDGDFNLGIGNGYMLFYRGNNGTLTTTIPSSLVFSASGTLNQGAIQVKPWFSGLSTLDYTSVTGNSSIQGFNLVGNPYPSTIDWETMGTTSTSGIYTTNIGNTIYILDPVTQGYSTYQKGGGYTLNGSRYIPSGQGFFVTATGTGAQLTFRENAKVNSQVSGNGLLLNVAQNKEEDRHIRIQLYKDVAIYDEAFIGFKQQANSAYVFNEDAPYKRGNGRISLSSLSSDNLPLAINFTTLPESKVTIPLSFSVNGTGAYKMNTTEIANIPNLFDVWLYDNLTKDSLDIRNNKEYNFLTSNDTTSYGANRFKIVLRQNPAKAVRLLSFGGDKAGKAINLNWTVENEANYTRYTLERSVDAGKSYQILDTLTSAALGTYTDLDPHPVDGLNQYRLKQTDIFGKVSYSPIVNVMYSPTAATNNLANKMISLYPNPVSTTVNVAITPTEQAAASYKITITNSTGVIVQSGTTSDVSWQGDVNKLLPGTYFVQVINTKDNTVTGKSAFIKL